MKILYHSVAPWVNTGYGRCTREIVPRLQQEGLEVEIQCINATRQDTLMWHGEQSNVELETPVRVHPAQEKDFGLNRLPRSFNESNADLLFTHFDTWMDPFNSVLPDLGIPYVSWIIVDHWPTPDKVVNQVSNAQEVISMSKYAQSAIDQRGIRSTYIPHGVDAEQYYPMENSSGGKPTTLEVENKDGEVYQKSVEDTFIVGMVAANFADRKRIPTHMQAFKMFLDEVDDEAVLYIHSKAKAPEGYNLQDIRESLGVPDENIIWADQSRYPEFDDWEMNGWYNAMDCLINCSMGESWGLTITEAMATGTPAIVNNFSSMPEQVGIDPVNPMWHRWLGPDSGRPIEPGNNTTEAPHGIICDPVTSVWRQKVSSQQWLVAPEDICEGMKMYYENPDAKEAHGKAARRHVLTNYTWDQHVVPKLIEVFNRVGEQL